MRISKCYILLALFIFVTISNANAQINKQQPVRITDLINAISDSLSKYYIFPDKVELISQYLHTKIKSRVYDSMLKEPQKLAKQIAKDIGSVHHDPHLRVEFDPNFGTQVAYNPTAEEMIHVKKYWKENNYSFKKVELLPGNIGYVSFNLFVDDIEAAKSTIKAALRFVANSDALIIDLRNNMGGNPKMVSQMESYFFNKKVEMNSLIDRSKKDTTFLYADPSKADSLFLPMPVYVLTSQQTFSGAEDFSYAMQVAKRAIIVGETTGGGAHPQRPFAVSQGFVVYIPFARSLNPITKTDWEGRGVVPDAKVSANYALQKAQELIFKNNITHAEDQKTKNKNQYHLNSLLESSKDVRLPVKKILPYIGTYGGLNIYIKENKLYCKNNNNGGSISELKHLSDNLFVLDKEAQIEFLKNNQNYVSGIKILVNDGSVFEETRTK